MHFTLYVKYRPFDFFSKLLATVNVYSTYLNSSFFCGLIFKNMPQKKFCENIFKMKLATKVISVISTETDTFSMNFKIWFGMDYLVTKLFASLFS